MTYQFILDFINKEDYFRNSYNIISNSDIYFDKTLSLLKTIDFESKKTCLALSRHEVDKEIIIKEPLKNFSKDSQDAWIFKGHAKIKDLKILNFKFGVPGCDNKFAYVLSNNNYKILNICHDVKIYHYHLQRPEKKKEVVLGPYKLVEESRQGL